MKIKPIMMEMVMHMSHKKEHLMTRHNEQYGIWLYMSTPVNIGGKRDRYFVLDDDPKQYRDMEEFKAVLAAKFPELVEVL